MSDGFGDFLMDFHVVSDDSSDDVYYVLGGVLAMFWRRSGGVSGDAFDEVLDAFLVAPAVFFQRRRHLFPGSEAPFSAPETAFPSSEMQFPASETPFSASEMPCSTPETPCSPSKLRFKLPKISFSMSRRRFQRQNCVFNIRNVVRSF